MSKRDWIIVIGLILMGTVIGFFIDRNTVAEPKPINLSSYKKTADSALAIKSYIEIENKELKRQFDSIVGTKIKDDKITKHDKDQIKHFTPTSRHRWADSLLRARGAR